MKTGRSINDLAAELTRRSESKKDYLADTPKLAFDESQMLAVGDLEPQPVTKFAQRQIGQRVGIPAKYFDRMAADAPELLATNVNHWFENAPERRLVRTLDGNVRAFLSDHYRTLDNFELAEAVLPRLLEADAQVESCEVTDSRMYIKAVVPGTTAEIPPEGVENWQWGKDHHTIDVVQPGIVISNSEIGAGALAVQPAIHTIKCSNLAVWRSDAMRKYHVGRVQGDADQSIQEIFSDRTKQLSDAALWSQVADLVDAALTGDIFEKIVARLKEARGMKIEADPAKVVEVVQERFTMTDEERGGVLRHLIEGGDLTAYGLHSAVTRFSQDVADYDRASELEQAGAEIIELAPQDWKVLAEAA